MQHQFRKISLTSLEILVLSVPRRSWVLQQRLGPKDGRQGVVRARPAAGVLALVGRPQEEPRQGRQGQLSGPQADPPGGRGGGGAILRCDQSGGQECGW